MANKKLNYLIIVLITAVFLWFFFRSVNWSETWRYLKQVNLFLMVLVVLLVPLHLVTRSIRWKFLLQPLKPEVSLWNAIEANTLGFTVTLIFPGRVGELVRPVYLAGKEKLSAGYLIGTIVVERMFDLLAMCSLLGVFLVLRPFYHHFLVARPEAYSHLYFWGKVGLGFSGFLLAVILGLYFLKNRAVKVICFLFKPLPEKIRVKIEGFSLEFIEGLRFFHSFFRLVSYFGLSLMVWLGICFFYWVFFLAYNLRVPFFLSIPYVFLTMVGASIPTPGMAGGFDYFSKLGFISIYGLDPSMAVGMTIVIHSVQILVTCALGYGILWKNGLSLFQVRKLGEGKN
ncbi:MAG: lysylphosphatidylglycerol synthase transmembrane domain-containing protein [Candidatus Saccharicenans sp.]|nr:MAG: hypothetical protein C0168_08790 [Candidatus Aminicenantes bacterium]HEK86055.1 flippase-like domain-containing protein [Candidatus Aminicenantes bacterium]